MKGKKTSGLMSALPICVIVLTVLLWGIMVWSPNSGGYELILYHPQACLIAGTILLTAMLVPLAFTRCRLDRTGGVCASVLPLAVLLDAVLLINGTHVLLGLCAGAWMLIWSMVAAIRHGTKKGLKIFFCVFSGIGAAGYLAVVLILVQAHMSIVMGGEVIRSAVSPDGSLIAEEIGYGEIDDTFHSIQIRSGEEFDVLIGRLQRKPEPIYNPFIGSAAIEGLDWADNDTLSLRYKGRDEPVLIDIEK